MKPKSAKLSKSILEMKFMKRTKEKVEKQQFQEEGEEYFAKQLPMNMKMETGSFIIEPSYVYCEQLIDGRVSYHGMNPEIETLMEEERLAKEETWNRQKQEADVSEEQMAEKWPTLREKLKHGAREDGKWTKNRSSTSDEPTRKKGKFLKPSD